VDRLKTAPIKAVHTLTAALNEGQTGLRILRLSHCSEIGWSKLGWLRHALVPERSGTSREMPLSL
jgi:hypothetical protein